MSYSRGSRSEEEKSGDERNSALESNQEEPMVSLDGIAASYGTVPVLSEIDLEVERGTFVGLIGPNGAGKTTLLDVLRGVHEPDRGRVQIAGESIRDLSARRAGQLVASVPQSTALSFEFTVRQVVEMGRTPHLGRLEGLGPDDREAVQSAMDRTEVAQFADRPVTDVSGGERQRVLLARALAQDTPVLVLDEPTASLDVDHAVRTLELVRDLLSDGRTVVAAIHDLNLAARYCDELVLLAGGAVRAAGPPAEVLTSATLEHAFGGQPLVTSQPTADAPLVTAHAERDSTDARVHVVGTGAETAVAVARLVAAGFAVSVGVIPEGDVAAPRARELDWRVVTVAPFTEIDADAREEAAEMAATADAVVTVGNVASGNSAVVAEGRRRLHVGTTESPTRADDQNDETTLEELPVRVADAVAGNRP